MVVRGVEVRFFFACALNLDSAEVAVPFVARRCSGIVKVPAGYFGCKVCLGSRYPGGAQRHFHEQCVARLHVKSGDYAFAAFTFEHRQREGVCDRSVELHYKEVALVYPHGVSYRACNGLVVKPLYFALSDLCVVLAFAPCRPVLQVYEQ